MRDYIMNENDTKLLVPASSGESMRPFIEWLKKYSTLRPQNVFEIGANMGQDAEALRSGFALRPDDVWTFEPHPLLDNYIRSNYKFNQFNYAVSDKSGKAQINVIDPNKNSNSGISSVRKHLKVRQSDFAQVQVDTIRMDDFMRENDIERIDFLKLDVEGLNYEVISGFGERIVDVQSLHVESEHEVTWEGEALWEDIRELLEPHFELIYFQRFFSQSDSFWVQKKYLKKD